MADEITEYGPGQAAAVERDRRALRRDAYRLEQSARASRGSDPAHRLAAMQAEAGALQVQATLTLAVEVQLLRHVLQQVADEADDIERQLAGRTIP